jgi:hypothetical protein
MGREVLLVEIWVMNLARMKMRANYLAVEKVAMGMGRDAERYWIGLHGCYS